MVGGHAVKDGVRASGVVANYATQRGAFSGSGVGAKLESVPGSGAVKRGENKTRLDGGGASFGIDFDEVVEVAGAVNDEGVSNRLTSQAGAGAAREDWNPIFCGQFNSGVQVILGTGNHNAERLHLINGGIGAVENARDGVEADFAAEMFLEFGDKVGGESHGAILMPIIKNV